MVFQNRQGKGEKSWPHVELNATDIVKAKTFYSKLFSWKLDDVPMDGGSYTMIRVGEGTGGGMMKQMVPGAPSAWLAFVQVEDIAAATQKAKSLGATVNERCDRSDGSRLAQHNCRSDGRIAWPLEAQDSLKLRRNGCRQMGGPQ